MRRLINRLPFVKSEPAAKRSPDQASWLRTILQSRNGRRALIGGFSGCLMLGLWGASGHLSPAFYSLTASQGMALSELHITGRNYTTHEHILSAVDAPYGTPLLSLNVKDIQSQLQQLGWVKYARVSRQFPDALTINLVERRPMALLQMTGGHRLIDQHGDIIFTADSADFAHLPVVAGDGAAAHAAAILDALKTEPELYADVWAIQRISDRRWNVHLRTGLEVKLPEMDAALAWSKLAVLDRDTQIMKRDLSMIDLRIPGQLIVQPNLPLAKKGRKT